MLTCDVSHSQGLSRVHGTPFGDDDLDGMTRNFAELERRVLEQFAREGVAPDDVELVRTLGMRFNMQVHTIETPVEAGRLDAAAGERQAYLGPEGFVATAVYGPVAASAKELP